jgi:hypothetical protein
MVEKLSLKAKRNYLYLALVLLVLAFFALFLIWYFSKTSQPIEKKFLPTGKSREEIIKELTAPEEKTEPLEEKIIQEISAPPEESAPLSEEIIENLSAPE